MSLGVYEMKYFFILSESLSSNQTTLKLHHIMPVLRITQLTKKFK